MQDSPELETPSVDEVYPIDCMIAVMASGLSNNQDSILQPSPQHMLVFVASDVCASVARNSASPLIHNGITKQYVIPFWF